jgi:hypothetical protein
MGKMLSSHAGLGHALPAAAITNELEHERDLLLEKICAVIGRKLTLEEIRRLKDNPEALESIQFEVDKALRKIATWQK